MENASEASGSGTGSWDNGDGAHVAGSALKSTMPDLVPVTVTDQHPGLESSTANSQDGNAKEAAAENSTVVRNRMVNGELAEIKKKIPVESLSKEELIVQVKKQMILLQKTKTKYDELQKRYTDLEVDQETKVNKDIDEARVAALEAELKQQKELTRRAQEVNTRSVADLELRDYQRTIAQLNEKVTAKDDCILRLTEQLHACEELLVVKQSASQEHLSNIQQLTEKTERLEEDLNTARLTALVNDKTIAALRQDSHGLQGRINELEGTIESHAGEQSDLVRTYSTLQETLASRDRQLHQKTAEISRLNVDVSQARSQHDLVMKEFEEYKVRAQTLLKQQSDTSKVSAQQREVEELHSRCVEVEKELADTRHQLSIFQKKATSEVKEKEALQRSFDSERVKADKLLLECQMKLRAVENNQESLRSVHEKKIDSYEAELKSLKELHGSTNDKMLDELLLLRSRNQELHEKVSSQVQDSSLLMEGPSYDRSKSEEFFAGDYHGSDEGSNGRSSPFSNMPTPLGRTISNMSSNTDKVSSSRVPLDQLIAFGPSVVDRVTTTAKDVDTRRINHLSELLHESENTNVQLHEQIRVLKHELRRIEHNVEREKHQDSMEYLKNVLIKFLTHSVAGHEQDKLIEVLTTILKLTVDERQQLMKATQPTHIPDHLRSWGTYLNPWKAKE